ncbi:hypothetical protein [Thiomicrospira sp.]|nr:hypothetical protein [Thiomicrospira sp.]
MIMQALYQGAILLEEIRNQAWWLATQHISMISQYSSLAACLE